MFALFSTQVVPGPQPGPVADLEPVSLVLTDKESALGHGKWFQGKWCWNRRTNRFHRGSREQNVTKQSRQRRADCYFSVPSQQLREKVKFY